MAKSTALRWKRIPRYTGLMAVGAAPRGSVLHDGETEFATTQCIGGGYRGPVTGWFWHCQSRGDIPHENTCNKPCKTEEEAKDQAIAYIKKHMQAK